MATITIDGKTYQVDPQKNLLHVCLSLGLNLPYFCWHPAMGSIGACRQCAVKQFKDENDQKGKIVMACMTPASDGTRISILDADAVQFRASVIEWLMINHPHDCPVCDEGGECHLQDMTEMTGHVYRRYRFTKRTYRNQYLGPFINHEMNRCIQCYRCVRFYRDFAGGRDFDVFAAHDHVYFGRYEDGVLESEFSGNLVEVCPTGVFTDKTLKQHYTRKWDLQTAPSVCVHCSLGCNTIPGERYGMLRRIRNRYHRDVNGYFLCDRGRYGYEFVNAPQRVRRLWMRDADGSLQPAPGDAVMEFLHQSLAQSGTVIGVGSPRASLEANFALRTLVGPEHFYAGTSPQQHALVASALEIMQNSPAPGASLHDVEMSDAVLLLGEDVSNTAPMLAYALRQAVRCQPMQIAARLKIPGWDDAAVREATQNEKGPLYMATAAATRLDPIAAQTLHLPPEDIARFGFGVAHQLDPLSPSVDLPQEVAELAQRAAQDLRQAESPLILSGVSSGSLSTLRAAANVARALCKLGRPAKLCLVFPASNSLGLALLGAQAFPSEEQGLSELAADATLVILETDLYRQIPAQQADQVLSAARQVIVLDCLENATTAHADVVLPAGTFAESDGTFVNNEGRAQRFLQVFVPQGEIQESWRWLRSLISDRGSQAADLWANLDGVLASLAGEFPALAPVVEIAPPETFRIVGQKIPRQPHRYSGRTAIHANRNVHETRPPEDVDAPLAFSMEGFKGQPPPSLIPRYWSPGWNSVQSLNKFQSEVAGPLQGGDPGRRLIEPAPQAESLYFSVAPDAFKPRQGQWLAVPLYHIFGSEELSMLTPGVAERAPAPYLTLNPQDAAALGVEAGQALTVSLPEGPFELPLRLEPSLTPGVVGLPKGLPDMPAFDLPAWVSLQPAGSVQEPRGEA